MAIFSNPLFVTYSVYARNASVVSVNISSPTGSQSLQNYCKWWMSFRPITNTESSTSTTSSLDSV